MKKNNTLKGRPERATAGKVSIATEHAGGVGGGFPRRPRRARRASDAPEARLLAGEVGADTGGRRGLFLDMPVLRRYRKLCTAFWN